MGFAYVMHPTSGLIGKGKFSLTRKDGGRTYFNDLEKEPYLIHADVREDFPEILPLIPGVKFQIWAPVGKCVETKYTSAQNFRNREEGDERENSESYDYTSTVWGWVDI